MNRCSCLHLLNRLDSQNTVRKWLGSPPPLPFQPALLGFEAPGLPDISGNPIASLLSDFLVLKTL